MVFLFGLFVNLNIDIIGFDVSCGVDRENSLDFSLSIPSKTHDIGNIHSYTRKIQNFLYRLFSLNTDFYPRSTCQIFVSMSNALKGVYLMSNLRVALNTRHL